ncbi:hypothetical protein [Xenorhabdus indica]|uniref:hypothetical protein n=1 Tax=Xenorhabdus indica TaxID=333964 RepID=UPI001656E4E3|nr:hypothetical protein [Xenorhabdus indica]
MAKQFWGSPYSDAIDNDPNLDNSRTLAAAYWKPKNIALKDIALSLAWSIVYFVVGKIL